MKPAVLVQTPRSQGQRKAHGARDVVKYIYTLDFVMDKELL
jgi:hypothetical protein